MSLKTAGSKLDSFGQLPTNMGLEKHVVNNGADPVHGQNARGSTLMKMLQYKVLELMLTLLALHHMLLILDHMRELSAISLGRHQRGRTLGKELLYKRKMREIKVLEMLLSRAKL